MKRFVAQFIGSSQNVEPMTAIARTANYAIEELYADLRKRLKQSVDPQIQAMLLTRVLPARFDLSDFQRDAYAVLHGSDNLRPHITIRRLPSEF